MRTSVNFNHLECFFSLARTLSFSKTSQELMIAQPAVSKQIKSLEQQYKVQLFLRTRQSVKLTTAGKQLYQEVWPLYNATCQSIDSVTSKVDKIAGEITFGCLGEVGEKVFIHAINKFKKQNPLISFKVKFLKTFEIIEGVKNGTIDIGVVHEEIIQENVRTYNILEEEIVMVTTPNNEKGSISKVAELPLATFRDNDPLLEHYIRRAYPKSKLNKLNVQFSVNSHKAMVAAIKEHDLYAVLPTLSIQKELQNKELINVGPKSIKSKLYLIHMDLDFMDKKLVQFRDFLKNYSKDFV